jgi:hypothetical protein
MARRTRPVSSSARWLGGALVAVLAIATIVLATAALAHVRSTTTGTAAPVPTFAAESSATPTASTPAPSPSTPSGTPTESLPPRSEERFLTAGSGTLWRATAGECGVVEPLVERSDDGGATWEDVTPRYRGIGEVIALDAFAGTEAEMIARMGPDCETQALRTFTQGEFWEPYPEVLAAARYPDPADRSTVTLGDGQTVAAPCADPRSFRSIGATVALVCDGQASTLSADATWQPAPATDVRAVTVDATGRVLTASTSDGCPGTTISSGPDVVACDPQATATPLTLVVLGDEVAVWSGEALSRVTL